LLDGAANAIDVPGAFGKITDDVELPVARLGASEPFDNQVQAFSGDHIADEGESQGSLFLCTRGNE
jgi:hypothetical protein